MTVRSVWMSQVSTVILSSQSKSEKKCQIGSAQRHALRDLALL